jgi:type I restriction enzyme, S subunit
MRSDAGAWQKLPIGAIADVVGGGTPSTKEGANFGGDIPWLTPKDLSDWRSRWVQGGERTITKRGLLTSAARLLPPKTVLVSSRAPIGYVALAARELATNQGFRSLILKDDHVPEFYYYVLRTMKPALEGASSGSTFKEISGSVMKSVYVPVPPTEEQARIAKVLGTLDDKIDSNSRLLTLLETLVEQEFS